MKKKKRIKNLKPSHREKKRYLLIKGKDLSKDAIDSCIMEFLGVLGYAEACPKIISKRKKSIVLSINRNSLDNVRSSFLMSGKDLNITRVSGSVKNIK